MISATFHRSSASSLVLLIEVDRLKGGSAGYFAGQLQIDQRKRADCALQRQSVAPSLRSCSSSAGSFFCWSPCGTPLLLPRYFQVWQNSRSDIFDRFNTVQS